MDKNFMAIFGRIIIGLFFVIAGVVNIFQWEPNLQVLQKHALYSPTPMLITGITAQIVLGALLIIGLAKRTCATLLILFTLASMFLYLDFWNTTGTQEVVIFTQFLDDFAIIGGLLLVIGAAGKEARRTNTYTG